MERLFIDTEFNDFGGKLISMAIVSDDGREFYEAIDLGDTFITPWVADNVMPVLDVLPIPYFEFQRRLLNFLRNYQSGFKVVADWPCDLKHFCDVIVPSPGVISINVPSFEMECKLDVYVSYPSDKPHNALSDAIALKKNIIWMERSSENRYCTCSWCKEVKGDEKWKVPTGRGLAKEVSCPKR